MKVIKTHDELCELHQHLRKFDIYHKGEKYKFQLSQLDAVENSRVSCILNTYSRKCGRDTKNFIMSVAFVFYIVYYFSAGGTFSSVTFGEMIPLIVCTILGAVIGKLLGLIYIRWKMIKFISRLITSEHSPEREF